MDQLKIIYLTYNIKRAVAEHKKELAVAFWRQLKVYMELT